MKYLSLGEAETKRQKAIESLHRIGEDDHAEKFVEMTPEEYAEHKGAEIIDNPGNSARRRNYTMANKTKDQLQGEVDASDYIRCCSVLGA